MEESDIVKARGHGLPFVIGRRAEATSFLPGYRGSWFRCEVKDISLRKGEIGALLDYYDFPDEKLKWLKLYQLLRIGKPKERRRKLMLRPEYPPIRRNNQNSDVNEVSEVIVVTDGVWKVGDLVDWWCNDSYWSGTVTEIKRNERAKITLFPLPFGEGSSDVASFNDLRPSLEWSVELGWSVPLSKGGEQPRYCAQLIQPAKRGREKPSLPLSTADPKKPVEPSTTPNQSITSNATGETNSSGKKKPEVPSSTAHPKEEPVEPSTSCKRHITSNAMGETSSSGRDAADSPTENGEHTDDELCGSHFLQRTFKRSRRVPVHPDPITAAILDLEELANKVKWLRVKLECGTPMSDAATTSWEFVHHRGSSIPR